MNKPHQKIVPHLWFDKEAAEAAEFYVSLFPDSKITGRTVLPGTPSGDAEIISFQLWGFRFMAISAGPYFIINQSISFHVYCGSDKEIERIYTALSEGGTILFPLGAYPWCRKYAWVQDRFGMTWQLDVDPVNSPQKIVPSLLFVNERVANVKPAMDYYTSVFPGSRILMEVPHNPEANLPESALNFAQYKLGGYLINSMSGPGQFNFDFNEAVSLMVYCENQDEIDYFWEKLSDDGQEQPCGWLKDRFGISWQVVPFEMDEMMQTTDKAQLERVMQAMMPMKKLDVQALSSAFRNI